MRIKMLLRQLLGLEYTRVVGCSFDDDGVVLDVAPTWRKPRCSGCGHGCPGYDRQRGRRWRHVDLAGMKFHLRYDTRRVDCPRCGVAVEYVPWADVGSWFTRPFEDHAGYLAQRCDQTTVSKLMRVAWTTVGQKLGIPEPEVVVTIRDGGRFVPNTPPIVRPTSRAPGGGVDLTNPKLVPPECIICVDPVPRTQ